MAKKTGQERRNWIRAKRVMSIQYRVFSSKRKNVNRDWCLSTTYDMSFGGVCFYTDQPLVVGDILDIDVVMSGVLQIFKGKAKVVRIEKKKCAVFFLTAVELLKKKKMEEKGVVQKTTVRKRHAKRI